MIRTYDLRVNGSDFTVKADEGTPLLYVLRNDVGLNSPKSGCDLAQCGACAVLVNGRKVPSCSTPVSEVASDEITTCEGLGTSTVGRALRAAFFQEQASQCGYCISGMMIGATALLTGNPSPSNDEIRASLNQHICRCGTHVRILAAVERAAAALTDGAASQSSSIRPESAAAMVPKGDRIAPASVSTRAHSGSLDSRQVDSWITIGRDGAVTAYCGKIDMGTGIRTALAQIVADELDVSIEKVVVVLGDTGLTPDQGKSTASAGVMTGGQPLRIAACETRAALMTRAAERLGTEVTGLEVRDGVVCVKGEPGRGMSYGDLIGNLQLSIELDVTEETAWGPVLRGSSPLKPSRDYRYAGKSVVRAAVADQVSGLAEYVHDVRIPGMLHGRMVRPASQGARLMSVDEGSIKHIPDVQIVRRGDFVGVVADREECAVAAARQLKVQWTPSGILGDERTQFIDLRQAKVIHEQVNFECGDVQAAIGRSHRVLKSDYHFAPQLHAMLGPSCAVADVTRNAATIWSGSQWPQGLRADLAQMLGLPAERVRVIWREASGSYGRLGCDDAAADAALMSQIIGQPVRVLWTREDENAWEPVSAATTISLEGALGEHGRIAAIDYVQWSSTHDNSERGNTIAWRLIGTAPGYDRLTGNIYGLEYDIKNKRGRSIFVPPTFRTIYLRGPGSVQSHFATESFMDELAGLAGVDPIEFRLRHLGERDREVLQTAARLAGWKPRAAEAKSATVGRVLRGKGVAFCRYGLRDTIVAVVAEVEVDRATAEARARRVWVAQDCGFMVNPDGVLNQVQGNIVHAVSRALKEELHYTQARVTSLNWDQYETLRFCEIPEIRVELIQRTDLPPSVVGEIASVPTVAAIANAIFDATGKRIREAPFTPARMRVMLEGGHAER